MEHKKYHTVRTILKIQHWQNNSNIQSKIVETETKSKHRSFSYIVRDTSIEPTSCLKSTHDSCIYLRILAPNTISISIDALSVNNNTTSVTTVAEPSGTPEITAQFLQGLVLLDVSVFCRSLFIPLSLLLYNWFR
jgi:hypothetical protein